MSPALIKPAKFKLLSYCPRCGHTLTEDMTAEKRFGVEVTLCPAERIRFTFVEATETLHVVKL
jgi:uncharacterized Zn finger protein